MKKYVSVVQDTYKGGKLMVRCRVGLTRWLMRRLDYIKDRHFFYAIVVDRLTNEIRKESP